MIVIIVILVIIVIICHCIGMSVEDGLGIILENGGEKARTALLGVKDRSVLVRLKCSKCKWYNICYSVEEVLFFVRFTYPDGIVILCNECRVEIYQVVADDYIQQQREFLVNLPHYWGVLSYATASHVRALLYRTYNRKCGVFVWEYQRPEVTEIDENKVFIVAVTHVTRLISRLWYPGLRCGADTTTTYIVRSRINGRYYCAHRIGQFDNTDENWFNPEDMYWYNPCDTLEEALAEASDCSCPPFSRFVLGDTVKKTMQRSVWRLEDLCAFFIRNYSFQYQHELSQMTHIICRNTISDIRAEKRIS